MQKKLTSREELFCHLQAMLGSASEAAVQAGYSPENAASTAARLLARGEIVEACAQAAKRRLPDSARRGLERIAFGQVNDAVGLLFEEQPDPAGLAALDLFSVSEIKRPKGGGLEIKFHDRLGALKALAELPGDGQENGLGTLCLALEQGARGLRTGDPDAD